MNVPQLPVDDIRSYVDWLSAGRREGQRHALDLIALPATRREARFAEIPTAAVLHTLDAVVRHAADELLSAPDRAADLTGFVIEHLSLATAPRGAELTLQLLLGTAWKERANALRVSGRLQEAHAAAKQAMDIFAGDPAVALEYEMARRVEAFIRHQLGESDEPLRIIRDGVAVFRAHNDVAGELRSRIFEGFIEFDRERYAAAMEIFSDALTLAEQIEDHSTLASLHNNIGHSAERLGDPRKAIEHLVMALELFEVYGMPSERPRAVWGIAEIAANAGRVDQALSELERVAGELFDRGMPLESARVWLDVADLLVRTERFGEAKSLADDLAQRFTEAGAPREALRALGQLREAASHGSLDADAVRLAWETLTFRPEIRN